MGLMLQWLVYVVAQRPNWLAKPEARSSHTQPTPTMGGLSIVVVVLGYLLLEQATQNEPGWPLMLSLAAVAVVGLWDDLIALSARVRLVVHFVAAATVLWSLDLALPLWLMIVVVVGVVWFTNLFNFMDGIDGYAAIQALIYCLGALLIANGIPGWPGELLWPLAGSCLAFLTFNWPPAKIFMGDVGSGFLGLLIGVIVIYLWWTQTLPLISSLILLAGFWFDATYTLSIRILTRQKFTQAHRSHLYQHLAQRRGHQWTSMLLLSFGLFWLLPLAWLVQEQPVVWLESAAVQVLVLLLSIFPIGIACWRFKAGFAMDLQAAAAGPSQGEKE